MIFAYRHPASSLWIQTGLLGLIQTGKRAGDPAAALNHAACQTIEVVLARAKSVRPQFLDADPGGGGRASDGYLRVGRDS